MAWDVTVPGTYAESHIGNTATEAGAAANQAAANKIAKYDVLVLVGEQNNNNTAPFRRHW